MSTVDRAGAPVDGEAVYGRDLLVAHRIDLEQDVEVELAVTVGPPANSLAPRLVEGRVVDATGAVLVLEARGRLTRIAWQAIATIRDAVAAHPAL